MLDNKSKGVTESTSSQVVFISSIQDWVNIHGTIITTHHINRLNKKKYIHINNAEKLHNIPHGLIIKTLEKFGGERDACQGIYEKSIDNMQLMVRNETLSL